MSFLTPVMIMIMTDLMSVLLFVFIGPDPADPERVLIRKVLELRDGRYAYEETTITPNKSAGVPSVHTKAYKLHMWDLKEEVTQKELNVRL